MKIYCINLKRSQRRRQLMERQFERLKMTVEFITALDAREISAEQMLQMIDLDSVTSAPHWLSPGVIACALSHRLCYKKMMESQQPHALILEDDVILSSDISEVLENMAAQIKVNEVIMLYFQSSKTIRVSESGIFPLTAQHRLMYPVNFENLGSSGAYMISLPAAAQLYDHEFPVKSSADSWGHFIQRGRIKSLRTVMPFAAHSTLEESSVDYVDPKKPAGKIKNLISELRLFPFYQLLRLKRKRNWDNTTRHIFTMETSPLQEIEGKPAI